jgi:hypothetical protein
MNHRAIMTAALAALGGMCISCGGAAPGLAPAAGKVVCDGRPAAGAVLSFHRQAGGSAPPPGAADLIPTATVGDDGTFTVESYPLGAGIAPGTYKVLIQWAAAPEAAQAGDGTSSKTVSARGQKIVVTRRDKFGNVRDDRLKGRYADREKTPFKAEIRPGANDLGTYETTMK